MYISYFKNVKNKRAIVNKLQIEKTIGPSERILRGIKTPRPCFSKVQVNCSA